MTRLNVAVLVAVMAAASAAQAAGKRVLVFQLDGSVPNDPGKGVARLTKVVARAAGLTGAEVIEGQASFEDTTAVAGCESPDAPCFAKMAKALKVDYVVQGTIEPSSDGKTVAVALKLYKDGEVTSHTIELDVGPIDAMVEALAREAPALFVGPSARPKETEPTPAPTPTPTPEAHETRPSPTPVPAPAPQRADEEGGGGGVSAVSWVIAGAGVLLLGGAGAAFYLAKQKQDEVDKAPTGTPGDFDKLVDLEDQGEQLTRIGDGLLIGGGAALLIGGGLILYQGLSSDDKEERSVSIAPVPLRGGVGLTFQLTLP